MNSFLANRFLAVSVGAVLCLSPAALMIVFALNSQPVAGNEPAQPAKDWSRYSPIDRAKCLDAIGVRGSYSNLLACLDRRQEARRRPGGAPKRVGQEHMPVIR